MTALSEWLREHDACEDAITWLGDRDDATAWRECERGDWLLWGAATAGVDRRLVVRAACACARPALPYVAAGELRPLRAIEDAEAWTRGEASIADARAAARAARSAAIDAENAGAWAASDAALAASAALPAVVTSAAAWAALAASAAALAASAAEIAVNSAVLSVRATARVTRPAARPAARAAARAAAHREHARLVREIITIDDVRSAMEVTP